MGGVRGMQFLFFDGYAWRENWDSATESAPLPRAVKWQLQLEPEEVESRLQPPIELVVPMTLDAVTNQTAQAGGSSS
jgi:hypothetical protein